MRAHKMAWQIRPSAVIGFYVSALLEIVGFLGAIYASAQLASRLATFASTGVTDGIWLWLWLDIGLGVITALAFWGMSWTKQLLYFRTTVWATREFHASLAHVDISKFYEEDFRNKLNKVQEGYNYRVSNLLSATLDLIYGILRFLVTAIIVAQIAWWLIPLIALFLIPSLIAESKGAKVRWFIWDSRGDDRHIFWGLSYLLREPQNQMEVRTFQSQNYIVRKIEDMHSLFYGDQEKQSKKINRIAVPAKVLESVGVAIGAVSLVKQFLGGALAFDRYLFLSGALLRINGALSNIFGTLARMQEDILFIEDFIYIIEAKPALIDIPGAKTLDTKNAPKIEFRNVSFTYPKQKKPVFKNLSFIIEPGAHVALVGENGAGKSTIIKLLMRFYVPDSGKILINDIELSDLAIESWYEQVATLFQDFIRYPLSIEENVKIGQPNRNLNRKQFNAAVAQANVAGFVKKFEYGWETFLNNSFKKGIEPSGGQWQRVALARAFYRNASMLILDEPTAAVDAKAEYEIFNAIFKHYSDKTALIVSHRFSTVRKADTIIVIEDGSILEQGSHELLMKKKGLYYTLFSTQAEGYK